MKNLTRALAGVCLLLALVGSALAQPLTISSLPLANTLQGNEYVLLSQPNNAGSFNSVKATTSMIAALASGNLTVGQTNILGTCTNGSVLYNNASKLGCEIVNAGIIAGTTTVTGPCTNGLFLYNNSGIVGCTSSSVSITFPQSVGGTTTSGGVPYFSSTSQLSSSGLLGANALLVGGGAGSSPASLASLGTTTTVLHGNAAGLPTFGAVNLAADVSGLLPNANLANPATTVNSQTCTLGSTCTVTAVASSLVVGTTTITSGTNGRLEYNNSGVLGELALGTGVATALGNNVNASGGFPTVPVANAQLANSSLTIAGHSVSLGGTQTIACGDLSNSGTGCQAAVASGTSGQVAYYSASSATISGESLSALIDAAIGSAQGDVLYRGASTWAVLAPGTSGFFLKTQGAGANPVWATAGGGGSGCSVTGTQYQVLVVNAAGTGCDADSSGTLNAGALVLGASGTPGSVQMGNSTSGTVTLQPATGALGSVTATFPANTGQVGEINYSQTWSGFNNYNPGALVLVGSTSGTISLYAAAIAGTGTVATFPGSTGTVAELELVQTFSALDTFSAGIVPLYASLGYTTTATAAGTTTLTIASTENQFFTGTTTQTVKLPVTSTLTLGEQYNVFNASTGAVTIQSSGANNVLVLAGGTTATFTVVSTSGTTAASWSSSYGGTSVASGKVATFSNSVTFAGTDGTTMTFPGSSATVAGLAIAETWTAAQTFTNSDIKLLGSSTGASTFTSLNAGASNYTVSVPAASFTIAALDTTDQTLSGGANVTVNHVTTGNVTVDCGLSPLQYITNGGAFTITAPANDGSCILQLENNGSAGAVTFSGFNVGSNTGDTLDTTNAHYFDVSITRIHSRSVYSIQAQQ